MILGRRNKPTVSERIRVAAWPRSGWRRSFRYFGKRILRLSGSPYAIGVGVAAGVAVSWTPFVGFHFLMSAFIAFVLGGNLVASALGTAAGNPLTFPFMWGSAYGLGHLILGGTKDTAALSHFGGNLRHQSFDQIWPILKPTLVGAVPLGVVSGLATYFVVALIVRGYQASRRHRLATRRQVRMANGGKPEEAIEDA